MAQFVDELERNEFYRSLQTKYAKKYEHAQKMCWVICIPQQSCLTGVYISSELIDNHILKPSPFFKSHYLSIGVRGSESLELENDVIKTQSGRKIKILLEETGYNGDYKPFKVLIIERPLNSDYQTQNDSTHHTRDSIGESYTCNSSSCIKLLESMPDFLNALTKMIQHFSSSYMILPDYLHDASVKLRSIVDWATPMICQSSQRSALDGQVSSEKVLALEYYILHQVHNKVFPVIKNSLSEEDSDVTQKLFSLNETGLSPDQLGVKELFCCPTPSAVVELASLNQKTTPVEKLICLVTTLELLNQDIENSLKDTYSPVNPNVETPCLSSDDLIPLLVSVIIKARPMYLSSNLFYVQNFSWYLSTKPKYSFSLVTFQAAKEFIRSNSFSTPTTATSKIKKEMTLEELMQRSVRFQENQQAIAEPKPQHSTFDYQLEHVTKMIEASTIDLRHERYKKDM